MLRRAGDLLAPDDPEAAAILHGASEGGMPSPQTEEDHRQAVAILDRSLGATQRKFVQTLHPVKGAGDQWVPCLHYPGGLAG
jgi:hypothetical protein